jgi:hypothetical protein
MDELINKIIEGAVWPFVIFLSSLAVAIFIWGIIEFIAGADNEEKRITGKRHLMWGAIGMFIMFSVYGIIQIIQNFISSID